MTAVIDRARLDPVISTIYETALSPEGWPDLLARITGLFQAGFADIFSRTDDREQYHGLSHGIDAADYRDQFLGHWFQRNVFREVSPPRIAGEIVQTRDMLPPGVLAGSDIFNLYMNPRGLQEGLRLTIRVQDGWVQTLSLLRPFSIGPYASHEFAMAEILMPHLQRAADVAQRLGETEGIIAGNVASVEAMHKAAFLLDSQGQVLRINALAESLLARADSLVLRGAALSAMTPAASVKLREMILRAAAPPRGDLARTAQTVMLPRSRQAGRVMVTAVPLNLRAEWCIRRPPAAMVFVSDCETAPALTAGYLMSAYGLTQAEADLALDLLAGHDLAEIAGRRNRSINTVRSHLSHLMSKTQVHRQADLVRLLLSLPAA